jgi:3'(2'), 5'-bisphosphate nucleotidase
MAYEAELNLALESVAKACRICEAVRAEPVSEETISKKDKSPVTVADYAVQAQVNMALAQAFPRDPIVAEEDTAELRNEAGVRAKVTRYVRAIVPDVNESQVIAAIERGKHGGGAHGRFWTLDPIDGTKGFLRSEQYAVALALIENGRVVLGILGCPNYPHDWAKPDGPKGCLYAAIEGQGAWKYLPGGTARQTLRVTPIADPALASFCESVESAHSAHGAAAHVAEILGVTAPPIRMDSQCKYAAVAGGDASIYLRLPTRADYEEKIWDHAAGYLIIREAGGQVSDIHGEPLDFSQGRTLSRNKGVVATNGKLHTPVIAAIQQALASE